MRTRLTIGISSFSLVFSACGPVDTREENLGRVSLATEPCDLSARFEAAVDVFPNFELDDLDGLTLSSDGNTAYLSRPHLTSVHTS